MEKKDYLRQKKDSFSKKRGCKMGTFQESATMPLPTESFVITDENLQLRYFMTPNLEGYGKYNKSKLIFKFTSIKTDLFEFSTFISGS